METLGAKLAKARTDRHLSLRAVESKTGIHNAHLSQIETGVIARPDPNILWTLGTLYELDYNDLLILAGHLAPSTEGISRPQLTAAMRSLVDLSPDDQREVVEFINKMKERKTERA
jgi:transcriptional regulator with XRE-family HTH domain